MEPAAVCRCEIVVLTEVSPPEAMRIRGELDLRHSGQGAIGAGAAHAGFDSAPALTAYADRLERVSRASAANGPHGVAARRRATSRGRGA